MVLGWGVEGTEGLLSDTLPSAVALVVKEAETEA